MVLFTRLARSTDGGLTWSQLDRAPVNIDFAAVDPEYGIIYAVSNCPGSCVAGRSTSARRIFFSTDGRKWSVLPACPWVNGLTAIAGVVYAATSGGLQVFDPLAGSRQRRGPEIAIRSVAVARAAPHRVYVLPETSGVLTSIEGESEWAEASEGLPASSANSIAISSSEPSIASAATNAGMFKTTDRGDTWTLVDERFSSDVSVGPDSAASVYSYTRSIVQQAAVASVQKSMDGGLTWSGVTPAVGRRMNPLEVAPTDPSVVYTALANGLSKSVDGGSSWEAVMNGIDLDDDDFYYGFGVYSLSVDRTDSSRVFAAKSSGVYRTTDGGARWNFQYGPRAARAIAFDGRDPAIVYAASSAGVFRTADDGDTWARAGLNDKFICALASHGASLYAGTADGRVYRTQDGGDHWSGLGGPARALISKLAVDPSGTHIFASTRAGVYRYDDLHLPIAIDRLADETQRLGSLLDAVRDPQLKNALLVLPVDGDLADVTLTNRRDAPQDVVVIGVPGGAAFHLRLPPSSKPGEGAVRIDDAAARLDAPAPGALLFFVVDREGKPDAGADVSGAVQIWRQRDPSKAPLEQAIESIHAREFPDQPAAQIRGLVHDAAVEASVTIMNLSNDARTFVVAEHGKRGNTEFALTVEPFSVARSGLSDREFGTLNLTVDGGDSPRPWLFYASTTDRATGETQTFRFRRTETEVP
jgi:photosystem II stability/assembly factor-like uncharacterized protein